MLLIANAVFVSRSGAALDSKLQAIRDAGHPLCLADVAPEPIVPEENAAVYYRRAKDDVRAVSEELNAVYSSENWAHGQLSQEQLQTIQRTMAAYPDLILHLQQAAECSNSQPDVDYEVTFSEFISGSLEHVQAMRAVARYIQARSLLLLAQEDREGALEASILNLRLASHVDSQSVLVTHLVAIAVRGIGLATANQVLRSGPVADSARDALDAELARIDLTEALGQAVIAERGLGLAAFNEFGLGRFWLTRGFANNAKIYYLDVLDSQLVQASQPFHEVLQAGPPAVAKRLSPWNMLADMVLPGIDAARQATERNRATTRCLLAVNALTRLEQEGVQVTSLADLKLPQEKTIDPFTGESLLMKKTPDGWVVYSVGNNLMDDGGQVDDLADFGLGPVPAIPSLQSP